MNSPKKTAPASSTSPAAAADEMDGGITLVDDRRVRIILDGNGVFKRTEPLDAKARPPAPTAMDTATATAAATTPAALDLVPDPAALPAAGPGSGTPFKAPM